MRLALAVENVVHLAFERAELLVDRRTLAAASRQLGEIILLYRMDDRGPSFFASARIAGLDVFDGGRFSCRLTGVQRFAHPVFGEAEARAPGTGRMLSLSDERFRVILDDGTAVTTAVGVDEGVVPFLARPKPLDSYLEIRSEVLRRWEYRCAVTDVQFAPGEAPELRLVPIRPRERGGPLEVGNYLPMVEIAEHAWQAGFLSVTDALDFVMVIDRLDPDMFAAMSPRLLLPDDPSLGPDPAHLAYHRNYVFGARP